MVLEVVTLCGVFAIDGGTLYLLPGPWSLEFHEQWGGQVGLSKEGSKEAEVVSERQAAFTSPGWSGAEPPQAGV